MAAENRDFLAEVEQLRVETDGIRNVLVSKPVQFQNLLSVALKEIMGELKEMRKEIKEGKEQNEKKLEEMRKKNLEMQQKNEKQLEELKLEMKNGFLEQNMKMQVQFEEILEENREMLRNNHKKFEDLKLKMRNEFYEQNLQMQDQIQEILEGNQEMQRKNDKKFEELKKQNLEMQQKMEEQLTALKNQVVKLSEQKDEEKRSEKVDKPKEDPVVPENNAETARKIPIREAVLGEWKMVGHENWEGFKRFYADTFEQFSGNLKFELENGKLFQSRAGYSYRIEEDDQGLKVLYSEDDHLKIFHEVYDTEDFYIQNGSLHFVQKFEGDVFERIYEKI